MLGSLVGGMIIVTNTRTLLRGEWIDASDPVQYGVYAVIFLVWAAAVVHSFRQYRKDKALESAAAVAAIADVNEMDEPDVVATPAPVEPEVPVGRPSAPRD
jgi:hypothetical protein